MEDLHRVNPETEPGSYFVTVKRNLRRPQQAVEAIHANGLNRDECCRQYRRGLLRDLRTPMCDNPNLQR